MEGNCILYKTMMIVMVIMMIMMVMMIIMIIVNPYLSSECHSFLYDGGDIYFKKITTGVSQNLILHNHRPAKGIRESTYK
jgi:hypothetical protein